MDPVLLPPLPVDLLDDPLPSVDPPQDDPLPADPPLPDDPLTTPPLDFQALFRWYWDTL